MTENLSQNTQAILMLTAPLIVGKNGTSAKLLSLVEYSKLAQRLHQLQKQPADLVSTEAAAVIDSCDDTVPRDRLTELLSRGFLLSQAIERWHSRALWVVSRADPQYPQKLKSRLKSSAPPILYGCGHIGMLDQSGFAVVGSRHVDQALIESTMAVGDLTARAHKVLVSGGAKGIDQAAMTGALEAGGQAVGVLADSLEKAALKREHRNYIKDGKLVLLSPYDPSAGFNVGHAMQRNKLIYGLADASLVMSSDLDRGGTWAGATEQLDRLRFVPVYVRATGEVSNGLSALLRRGGIAWPNPKTVESFDSTFCKCSNDQFIKMDQPLLDLSSSQTAKGSSGQIHALEQPSGISNASETTSEPIANDLSPVLSEMSVRGALRNEPAENLFASVKQAFQNLLKEPLKEADIASRLEVSKPQVRLWLKRLLEEGAVYKNKKPAGYVAKQSHLFN